MSHLYSESIVFLRKKFQAKEMLTVWREECAKVVMFDFFYYMHVLNTPQIFFNFTIK